MLKNVKYLIIGLLVNFYFVFHYAIDKGLKELVDIAVNKLF